MTVMVMDLINRMSYGVVDPVRERVGRRQVDDVRSALLIAFDDGRQFRNTQWRAFPWMDADAATRFEKALGHAHAAGEQTRRWSGAGRAS